MKKSIIFAALAAAAVAMPSCSSDDDVINNEGEGIRFSVYAGKTSRAVAVDDNSINKFHIWGVAANNKAGFFMNCDVTKVDGAWTYSPTKFWPQSNPVNFFAVSAGTKTGGYVDITGSVTPSYAEGVGGIELKNYKVVDNADLDVLYAAYYGAHKATGTVPLNFHHALSQLAFQAKCTNTDLTVYIKSIKVQNLCNQGSFAGPKATTQSWLSSDTGATTETGDSWGKWSGQQGKVEYTAPFYGDANVALTATAADYSKTADGAYDGLLVLPQTITPWDCLSYGQAADLTGSRFLIECRILSGDATLGKTQIWPAENEKYAYVAIPVPAKTWKQGMRYVYTFNFNEGAGYTPDPDPEDPNDPDKPQPVLSKVKISVTVDEFQNGGVIETVDMGTAN